MGLHQGWHSWQLETLRSNQLKIRNTEIDIDKIKDLDENNRKLIQKKESLESEKKDISKSKDESLFKRSKEISKELDVISNEQKRIKLHLDTILSNIPNIPHKDVPIGEDENANIEISNPGKFQVLILSQKHIMN